MYEKDKEMFIENNYDIVTRTCDNQEEWDFKEPYTLRIKTQKLTTERMFIFYKILYILRKMFNK